MDIIIIVERDYSYRDPDMCDRYVGGVCHTFEEAREVVYNHRRWGCDLSASYVNNGIDYVAVNGETGELEAQYFVRLIGHD